MEEFLNALHNLDSVNSDVDAEVDSEVFFIELSDDHPVNRELLWCEENLRNFFAY